jgi:hypothetical protein
MTLYNFIRPALLRPFSPLGKAACAAYEALPDELRWRPATPGTAISRVLSYGVPLSVIGNNQSFQLLIQDSVLGILQSGRMAKHVWGVMHAGALLSRLGSQVEFPKAPGTRRTPDIRAFWSASAPVDCEVTTVDVKPEQDRLENLLDTIVQQISGGDSHLLLHLSSDFGANLINDLLDAALRIRSR